MYPIQLKDNVADRHEQVYMPDLVAILEHLIAGHSLSLRKECIIDDAEDYHNDAGIAYFSLIKGFLEDRHLLKALPDDLAVIKDEEATQFKKLKCMSGHECLESCRAFVGRIFDYDLFSKNSHPKLRSGSMQGSHYVGQEKNLGEWGGWKYIRKSNVRYCPYCNSSDIYAIEKSDGARIKSALDHYFSKEDYPFMQLSLYNLIPSCTECNTGIKGRKKVVWHELPHPHLKEDNVHKLIEFGFEAGSYENFYGAFGQSDFMLKATPRNGSVGRARLMADAFLTFFETNAVYSKFATEDTIGYLMQDLDDLNSEYVEDMVAQVGWDKVFEQIQNRLHCRMSSARINLGRHEKLKIDFACRYLSCFKQRGISAI